MQFFAEMRKKKKETALLNGGMQVMTWENQTMESSLDLEFYLAE